MTSFGVDTRCHPDSNASPTPTKLGAFIVIEGGEGAGKTTQIQKLQQWLLTDPLVRSLYPQSNITVNLTREPGGTSLGQSIRDLLLNPDPAATIQSTAELFLYAADRAQHVESYLKPALANGAIVLCDRYTDSTLAYQGYGRGLDLNLIEQLNAIATGGLQSDLTLWLDVDVEIGLQRTQSRGGLDRLEQASLSFHQQVRAGFQALATQYPQRIVRIDASADADHVAEQIQSVIIERFRQWYSIHSACS